MLEFKPEDIFFFLLIYVVFKLATIHKFTSVQKQLCIDTCKVMYSETVNLKNEEKYVFESRNTQHLK